MKRQFQLIVLAGLWAVALISGGAYITSAALSRKTKETKACQCTAACADGCECELGGACNCAACICPEKRLPE